MLNDPARLRLFCRTNLLIACCFFMLTLYCYITNDYANLQARQYMEARLDLFAVGSLIYASGIWLFGQFAKQK